MTDGTHQNQQVGILLANDHALMREQIWHMVQGAQGKEERDHGAQARFPFTWKTVRRIHIIGGPGAGKTTLAGWLGSHLGLPVYHLHLDAICSGGVRIDAGGPFNRRLAEVGQIAEQLAWITEGSYLWWTEDLLRSADLVIWLDLPWPLALWRVLRRALHDKPKRFPLALRLYKFLRFLPMKWSYYHNARPISRNWQGNDVGRNRVTTRLYVLPYTDKLLHLRSCAEVADLMIHLMQQKAYQ